jgi:hypothetical protein
MTASPAGANQAQLIAPAARTVLTVGSEAKFPVNDDGMAGRFVRASTPP